MKTISAKLRSNRGSSMIMALLLMLVAVMVSHTILAAAATAGRNVQMEDDGQQAYLTVSSAAKTFRDAALSFNSKFKKSVRNSYANPVDYASEKPKTTEITYTELPTSPFSAEVGAALKYAIAFPSITYTHTYLIRVDKYDDVDMVLTLKKNPNAQNDNTYLLTATFSNVIPGRKLPDDPCQITVTLDAILGTVRDETASDPEALWKKTTVTWSISGPVMSRTEEANNG